MKNGYFPKLRALLGLFLVLSAFGLSACPGPDPGPDPSDTVSAEYRFPAAVDPDVMPEVATEIWAQLYRPRDLGDQPHPVLVFLTGNHATCGKGESPRVDSSCQYTFTGTCGEGETVVPSHLGYEYLATRLAALGYVVVSINTNRGISCGEPVSPDDGGLILARGRLLLKHLSLLSRWNREGGAPSSIGAELKGKLDLQEVGLLGHSRGGEGVRAAYNLYRAAGSSWPAAIGEPVSFKAIFEIGPTDRQSPTRFDAVGTAWNVLLPMCDGDISHLEGMKPFDRMLRASGEAPALPKSMLAVWGANHNYYNTEWQTSDSKGCYGAEPLWSGTVGSAEQRETAIAGVVPFFQAFVGKARDPRLAAFFDPRFALPDQLASIARVDRAYLPSPAGTHFERLETFEAAAGTGSSGVAQDRAAVAVAHVQVKEHDSVLRAAELSWTGSGADVFFQDNWSPSGTGLDLSNAQTLDFRVSRAESPLNGTDATDFAIRLVRPDGTLGPEARLSTYASLAGPVGIEGDLHHPLQTVRIPLADLGGLAQARGVRLIFDGSASGDIYLADIGFALKGSDPWGDASPWAAIASSGPGIGSRAQALGGFHPAPGYSEPALGARPSHRLARAERAATRGETVELEFESSEPFQVRDALPELWLDGKLAGIGFFPRTGDLRRMIFRVPIDLLRALPEEFEASLRHREDFRGQARELGRLRKGALPSLD